MRASTAVIETEANDLSFYDIGGSYIGAVDANDAKAQDDVVGCTPTIEAHASSQEQRARDEDQLHALNTTQ